MSDITKIILLGGGVTFGLLIGQLLAILFRLYLEKREDDRERREVMALRAEEKARRKKWERVQARRKKWEETGIWDEVDGRKS